MPNVVGEPRETAASKLASAGLSLGSETRQCSGEVGEGAVISTSPSAGVPEQPGAAVSLLESSGPCPVIEQNVFGQSPANATAVLQGQGLTVTTTGTLACGAAESGDVVSQSPPAGTHIGIGSDVTIAECDMVG